ncbi:MAG: AAA family ATPase [Rhodomicrobium sp.]|nr:AAA family ATPase [Rhodomicrobium sp.]
MARSDLIISLIRAGAAGDRTMLRSTAEALAAEERAKKHNIVADRIVGALQANGHQAASISPVQSSNPGKDFIAEKVPQLRIEDLVLPETVRSNVSNLVEEQHRADLLRSHGLQPRHRVLLSGPPGNGKTALAEGIAEALAVPFFTVRYEALIGSYLGETTQRLRRLFDYVRTTPCVLFFDEFDAVGKERGDVHETGEIKRVVSSLLLQVDALPSYVAVIAATNHAELLDRAVWRRFQLRLPMPLPSADELTLFLSRAFEKFPEPVEIAPRTVAKQLEAVSYAEATEFCIDVRRRHVLSLGRKRIADCVKEVLLLWSARVSPETNAERSNKTSTEVRRSSTGRKKGTESKHTVSGELFPEQAKSPARTEVRKTSSNTKSRRRSADAA